MISPTPNRTVLCDSSCAISSWPKTSSARRSRRDTNYFILSRIVNVSIQSFRLLAWRVGMRQSAPYIEAAYCWRASAYVRSRRLLRPANICEPTDVPSSVPKRAPPYRWAVLSSIILSDISNASRGRMKVFCALQAAAYHRPAYPPIYDPTSPPASRRQTQRRPGAERSPRGGLVSSVGPRRRRLAQYYIELTGGRGRSLKMKQNDQGAVAGELALVCLPQVRSYLHQRNILMYLNRGDDRQMLACVC